MCDGKNHKLEEIIRARTPTADVYNVVRWCKDCGGIVVDEEVDGRTYAGKWQNMKFPSLVVTK